MSICTHSHLLTPTHRRVTAREQRKFLTFCPKFLFGLPETALYLFGVTHLDKEKRMYFWSLKAC